MWYCLTVKCFNHHKPLYQLFRLNCSRILNTIKIRYRKSGHLAVVLICGQAACRLLQCLEIEFHLSKVRVTRPRMGWMKKENEATNSKYKFLFFVLSWHIVVLLWKYNLGTVLTSATELGDFKRLFNYKRRPKCLVKFVGYFEKQ